MAGVIALAGEWNDAVRAHDDAKLRAITAVDIILSGPKGTSQGWDAQSAWMNDAGARFVTLQAYVKGDTAVLFQEGFWHENPVGAQTALRQTLATVYRARDGLLFSIDRHWSLDAALETADLSGMDRVELG